MACSKCREPGHNKRSCKKNMEHNLNSSSDVNTDKTTTITSRGASSFKSGKAYQSTICQRINSIGVKTVEVEGAKSGADIIVFINGQPIGIETKKKRAFEGGSCKMNYNNSTSRLEFRENTIHNKILGDTVVYDGQNLPYYQDKKTLADWKEKEEVFSNDVYIPIEDSTVSSYYLQTGVYYIQIEGKGLYHTGVDILDIGVPYFKCKQTLRIRTSKHIKKGVHTDVVGDINYDKKSLVESTYSLDDDVSFILKTGE